MSGTFNCGQTNVRTRANTAFSIYNGLQASLTTRNFHGVTATAAYTYSQTIDNSSEIFGTFGGGNTVAFAQNPFNNNIGERAESGYLLPERCQHQLYLFRSQRSDRPAAWSASWSMAGR